MEKHEQLFVSIRKIIRSIDVRSRKLSKESGVTGPQLLVLQELARKKGVTAKDVSGELSLSQATVTSILDRLEGRGLVKRIRSSIDRRRVALFLTPQGRHLLLSAPQPLEDAFIKRFSSLKEREQLQLLASVEQIADMLDASHFDIPPFMSLCEFSRESE